MTSAVLHKLLAIFVTVAIGWFVGRMRWLGPGVGGQDPARVLGNAAFYLFVPALLFRTTARVDLATMPWRLVAAYFLPVIAVMAVVYGQQRGEKRHGAAVPSVRAIAVGFGNTVQIGIPVASAMFGEAGLALHLAIVSLHALILLAVITVAVELDLARERATGDPRGGRLWSTLRITVRNTVIHPVTLPILAGLAWNLAGAGLPPVLDESLMLLGSAVVPLCLVLIGMSLAYVGVSRPIGGAVAVALAKMLLLPVVVLLAARFAFGLRGLPLSVLVMLAALPCGSNALIFSQRYATLENETATAIVISTLAYVVMAPVWLGLLAWLAG